MSENNENEKNVYVVYQVDLDDDCLKKSEIKILAVYTNYADAKNLVDSYDSWEGYCEDSRCYYVDYEKMQIDKFVPLYTNDSDSDSD